MSNASGQASLVAKVKFPGSDRTCLRLLCWSRRGEIRAREDISVGTKRLLTAAVIGILLAGSLAARAAGSQSGHWAQASLFHQMDTNRNGTVSKIEFLRFMSRKFNRLDTNRNGKLERKELLPLVRGGAMRY
jgi:hypothetical protein